MVVRTEGDGYTLARGKLVRAEFTQAIESHRASGPPVVNTLTNPASTPEGMTGGRRWRRNRSPQVR